VRSLTVYQAGTKPIAIMIKGDIVEYETLLLTFWFERTLKTLEGRVFIVIEKHASGVPD
tara:strand:- start:1668 stop:1844 length:177 start_codon:yes stop_codon:yes gene_type:complete